jgi:hypothetical protein
MSPQKLKLRDSESLHWSFMNGTALFPYRLPSSINS